MSFITRIRPKGKDGYKRAARAMLTVVVVSAVALVGLILFSSEVLGAWTDPGNNEQALAPRNAVGELLTFDAPALTGSRLEVNANERLRVQNGISDDFLLVKNWKFTDQVTDIVFNAWFLSQTLYLETVQMLLLEAFLNSFPTLVNEAQLDAFVNLVFNANAAFQAQLNALVPPGFQPPSIASLSPFK